MAENIIKDFVKKQTSTVTIGVPKQRPQETEPEVIKNHVEREVPVQPISTPKKRPIGRPHGEVEKEKISVYIPKEWKPKLQTIQHLEFKSNMNDVVLEAIRDLLQKNKML